ncbi:MAG TPA: PQQ-binding-like beta-propeller repeat protein [Rhizomicrobium sp.]|nr:PQQ-binding-like beta-propeller repeat protein [Rhizomicrobium sp.]
MIKGQKKISMRAFAAMTLAAAGAVGLWTWDAVAQTSPGPFTDAQAQAGQAVYTGKCAVCHEAGGETIKLIGAGFTDGWKSRSTKDLYTRIKTTMPLSNPGSLSDAEAASVVAYILKGNGAAAGAAALTPTTNVAIGGIIAARPDAYAGYVSLSGMPAATGITFPGTVEKYTPVTEEMLLNPPANDWLMHYQNYAGWSHSPLKQINTQNVKDLQLRWVWSMDDGERQQITPMVHDGVMFISTAINNKVQALNAATGDLIWENSLGPRLENQVNATARAMVLYGNQLFYPASDATLYALDARTGKINWKFKHTDYGRDKIGGLMIADGKLIVGRGVCDEAALEDRCFIAAYDVKDGHQLWKFNTVAYTGEPGGDSWGNMANGERAGADAWIAGTYDPKLRLVYFGTGQAKSGKNGIGDKLFSNATIALDVDTGKLKWYHQPAPDEGLDLDEVYEKILVDNGSQKLLLTAGKKGILWKLDRASGKFLDYVPMVFQNVFTSIDRKTGRGTYRADILHPEPGGSRPSCPAQSGGHNWPAASYVPEEDLIIFPLDQICVTSQGEMIGNYEAPASDGNMGRVSAYRVKDLKPVWTFQQRAPFLTSSMTTAGGVGFIGDWDRTFRAFDIKTGKTLWTTRLGTTAQGFPTTFTVDGEQFVAVPTGYNGGSPQIRPSSMFAFERNRPLVGHAVYVFALPKTK